MADGGSGLGIAERLKIAVDRAGARRGLALATRRTYGGWAARFGAWAGSAKRAMDEGVCRDWLSHLVAETKVSFATQKQALNALVFFFRDVCGRDEVDLAVKMRKRQRRIHVVLNLKEVLAVIAALEARYRTIATLQYGAGLRLKELVRLRVKDIDLKRGIVTIQGGKGDKDRVSVIPNLLKGALKGQVKTARGIWQEDRSCGVPGVALPEALGRKFSRAGEKWAWQWLFPAPDLSQATLSENF